MFFVIAIILFALILLGIVYLLYKVEKKLDTLNGLLVALDASVNRLDWRMKEQADSFQSELAHMNDLIGRHVMLAEGIETICNEIAAMEDHYSDIYEQFKFCYEQLDRIEEKLEAMKPKKKAAKKTPPMDLSDLEPDGNGILGECG